MSLDTWKREFYPKSAHEVGETLDNKLLLEHSIQKWKGLRAENREKHGVNFDYGNLSDATGATFGVDTSTCALCEVYFNDSVEGAEKRHCICCPLFELFGRRPCYGTSGHEPYSIWKNGRNPEPMILALERVLALIP